MRAKRPPLQCVALLGESEDQFRRRVGDLEETGLFRKLVRQGVVRRRGGRGRMPPERYEEYMEEQLLRFAQRYGLDQRPQWREDFLRPHAEDHLAALAERYGAPPGELAVVIRYLCRQQGPPAPARPVETAPDLADFLPGADDTDLTLPIEVVRHFVESHRLSESDLVTDFLHGEQDDGALVHKYHATPGEIAAVREAVNAVLIADAAAGSPGREAAVRREETDVPPPAAVVSRSHGRVTLQLLDDAGYALHYSISPERLTKEAFSAGELAEARALLGELRWINQRRSLVCRLIAHVFAHQRRYFETDDDLELRPLSQAELARALDEPQSSICRALRDKCLETPQGWFELRFFCQGKREVVRRLAAEYPQLSDRELQRLLAEKYGCQIARRTVAYHRGGAPAA